MAVADEKTVATYVRQFDQAFFMIENLREFVQTLPAPNENGVIPGVDYGFVNGIGKIHELLEQACEIADELSE
jgi:hypothetical protein